MRKNSKPPLVLFGASFMRDVVRELAPLPASEFVERGIFISGPQLKGLNICCHMSRRMSYQEQSASGIVATAASTLDALLELHRQGLIAHVFAHSHPGTGCSDATQPSRTDLRFMKNVQHDFRADMIGMIVLTPSEGMTFVRFFSPHMDFRIRVEGSGVYLSEKQGNEYVYRIEMQPTLRYRQTSQSARPALFCL